MSKKFLIILRKSLIGCTQSQKETVRCLGLKRIGGVSEVVDSPASRGQIMKVQHLLEVKVKR